MKMFLVLLMAFVVQVTSAQTIQEFTDQKKVQRKYLVQQIIGLKVYLEYAAKGYRLAKNGLATIGKIKEGDFSLHQAFFQSLQIVNPKIASSAKVAATLATGIQTIQGIREVVAAMKVSHQFTPEEIGAFSATLEGLLLSCTTTLDELIRLLTSGHYEMRDEERLKRVDQMANEMEAHYAYGMEQATRLKLLAQQRLAQQIEVTYSQKLK